MEKDNKKPAPAKKVVAPVQKKPKPEKKPAEPIQHTPGPLTATKKPSNSDKVVLNSTSTTEENASLLGRLRRAIGESAYKLPSNQVRPTEKTPDSVPKPPLYKKPRTGPLTTYSERGKTPRPVPPTVDPTKGSTTPPYKNFRKEEVELDEVSREKLKKYLRDRKAEIEANPEYSTSQKFRSRMSGGGTAIAKLGGRGSKRIKVPATKEEVEPTNEAVLNLAQRIKRAQIMRREAPKIERAREISRTRFARDSQLKNRAEALARRLVKKRFAGERGYDYQKLSTSEKMAIDAMVDKKVVLIQRLAKKMYPIVRRKEVARMLARHQGVNATPGASPVNIVNSYDPEMEIVEKKLRKVPKDPTTGEPAKYYEGLTKSEKLARAAHTKTNAQKDPSDPSAYNDFPGDKEARKRGMPLSPHTIRAREREKLGESDGPVVWSKGNYSIEKIGNKFALYDGKKKTKEFSSLSQAKKNVGHLTEQISGLKKKAEKSGISYGTLKKVYDRGMAAWRTGHRPGTTPQQWAFARVNSYITKGKGTYHGADKDLREEAELNEWYIDTASKYKPSRGDSIVTTNGGRVFGRVERVDEVSVYFRSQNDNRVYKTEINNVSKVDHWDGTLNENHSPECSDYEEKPSLSKRMKKAIKKDIKEAQRDADFEMEKYVDASGKTRFRKIRKIEAVDKGER